MYSHARTPQIAGEDGAAIAKLCRLDPARLQRPRLDLELVAEARRQDMDKMNRRALQIERLARRHERRRKELKRAADQRVEFENALWEARMGSLDSSVWLREMDF
jgi:hypothetical protein